MMKLGTLFSDGAVLQRNIRIPVWGTTQADSLVAAELNGKTSFTRSSREGAFLLRLPAMEAGGPYVLTVTNRTTGESVTLQDILIGEVWVASGQSNMEHRLGQDLAANVNKEDRPMLLHNRQKTEFCETLKNPEMLRAIEIPKQATGVRQASFDAKWNKLDSEHAGDYSAAGVWFIRYIQEKLNVPVGLISSSWGGSCVETWISRTGLLNNPDTAAFAEMVDHTYSLERTWTDRTYVDFPESDSGNKGFEKGFASPDFDDSAWKPLTIPGSWIQQKISGHGSIWARKTVTVPAEWEGREIILHTGGIDKHDVCYFNGTEVGHMGEKFDTQYWDTCREYKVPAELVKAGTALVAIRGFSFAYDGAFLGDPDDYYLACGDVRLPLDGVWKAEAEQDFGILNIPEGGPHPENFNTASNLFDSMIRPLIPYGIRGAIWYQGESNSGTPYSASIYRGEMASLIRDWRYHWEQGDFPFIQVQLAGFRAPASYQPQATWCMLRESQRLVCGDLPNVFMATLSDAGEADDIHPQDKKIVGYRLSRIALHETYGCEDVVPAGPLFQSVKTEGEWLRVNFENGKDMHFKDGIAKGFYVAGPSRCFHPADEAVIDGVSVLLRSEKVKTPVAVRYAWAENPDGSLYNGAELPASPFRSDNWTL